jgi:L-2,4-diaminobutyrate decarboxylase
MVEDPSPGNGSVNTNGSAAEALREAGHCLIDRMAAYLEDVDALPVSTLLSVDRLGDRFTSTLPRASRPAAEVWGEVWESVVNDSIHLHHPMYLGHQVAPPLPHAALADALASLLNQSIAVWEMSPTGTLLEAQVMRWLVGLVGYPATADGTLVSGGSAANLTGLLAAREARFPGAWRAGVARVPGLARSVVLGSPQAHYCIERSAGIMGLGSNSLLQVPERDGRMDPDALEQMLDEVRREGLLPLAIVATAGSTATGLFDPLDAISEIAQRHGCWLHVDGAHGASFLLSESLRHHLRGIERADSVAWDPHKMMWMPISLGAVLVRHHRHLDATFQQSAPYLFHPRSGESRSRDTGTRTLQCSRRFDALKLWVCLQLYGADHFAALAEKTVRNTRYLFDRLQEATDFEPMHVPESNILCFRHLPTGPGTVSAEHIDRFQTDLRSRYNASGRGWITSTVLEGRKVLRVTLINPATEPRHLDDMLEDLRREGARMITSEEYVHRR